MDTTRLLDRDVMPVKRQSKSIIGSALACAVSGAVVAMATWGWAADRVLFRPVDSDGILTNDATARVERTDGVPQLRVETGRSAHWPGVTIVAPDGAWDLSNHVEIQLELTNRSATPVTLYGRVDSPEADGVRNCMTQSVSIPPGEHRRLVVPLSRKLPPALAASLFGMRGFPGGYRKVDGVDASQITRLIVFVDQPTESFTFQIAEIRATGRHVSEAWESMPKSEFFPMIDPFGQFRHREWTGKTHDEEGLRREAEREVVDQRANPGPADWNRYGGWDAGPLLSATGFFRTERLHGQWWLVDPTGRLFWSHGVDCAGFSQSATPVTDREFYFAELPASGDPLSRYFGESNWAPHGYYQGRGTYRTYNFFAANLSRKYGSEWSPLAAAALHRRLRSWGMNTLGNWSDSQVAELRKTPYVIAAGSDGARRISGSSGYWGQFPDPFDPSLRQSLDQRLEVERNQSAGDPWCLGYFVDNELGWGDDLSLAIATLASPPDQPAKRTFLAELQDRYDSIESLNAQWKTRHVDWDSLAASQTPPDSHNARDDLARFTTRVAEAYFRTCRDAVKAIAPHQLYLGCRFAGVHDPAARVAGQYCDVLGCNLYEVSVADFRLPSGVDRPVIIGEFHFGALDRGMFHAGLRPTADQMQRADSYRKYVGGALRNPQIVGTHWFQYADQAPTGRGDGENYQIGLVDICDTPYPETIQAVREIGHSLYTTRTKAAPDRETEQGSSEDTKGTGR